MQDRFNFQTQIEHLHAKYVGTGTADTTRWEWGNHMYRDSLSSHIGHHSRLVSQSNMYKGVSGCGREWDIRKNEIQIHYQNDSTLWPSSSTKIERWLLIMLYTQMSFEFACWYVPSVQVKILSYFFLRYKVYCTRSYFKTFGMARVFLSIGGNLMVSKPFSNSITVGNWRDIVDVLIWYNLAN